MNLRRLMFRRFQLHWLFSLLFIASLLVSLWLGQGPALSQQSSASQLVQQGVDRYQQGDVQGAIALWQSALSQYQSQNTLESRAIVLENLARAYQRLGQIEQAIARWSEAVVVYQQLGNVAQTGRTLTEQAQTYLQLGQPQEAIRLLCNPAANSENCGQRSAVAIARSQRDRQGEASALGSLGEAYRMQGDNRTAGQVLEQGLAIARELQNPSLIISLLTSLGNNNIALAQINYQRANSAEQFGNTFQANRLRQDGVKGDTDALRLFREAVALSAQQQGRDSGSELRLLISVIAPEYRVGNLAEASEATKQALQLLSQIPDSQEKVYAAIDLARRLQPIPAVQIIPGLLDSIPPSELRLVQIGGISIRQCYAPSVEPQAIQLLEQATLVAQKVSDSRSESFARGELGRLYECRRDYSQALAQTQKARLAADQNLRAKDSLYLWEWQTARILKAQGKNDEAIAAYKKALSTLRDLRRDLLSASRSLQFDFRDTVDPLYRQAAEMQLAQVGNQTQPGQKELTNDEIQEDLKTALTTIDELRLAELENYFGDECVIPVVSSSLVASRNLLQQTAVFSSVVFENRTAIVLTLPDRTQRFNWIDVNSEDLRQEIRSYRQSLVASVLREKFDSTQAQQLYRQIITPFIDTLRQAKITTLVFVQDGVLRSVPMAALYDVENQKFLIEEFAIAATPSLTLTDLRPFNRQDMRVLALGVSERTVIQGQAFQPLRFVPQEISEVTAKLPHTTLLNRDFTSDRLRQALERRAYSVLHIATHGVFSAEPQNTFLVTGDSKKLTISDLEKLVRNTPSRGQIELLALTACETATGDDRSALGLAGVAVQAGAKSALASLWAVDDETTAKVAADFYTKLLSSTTVSKAEALRDAQLKVLKQGDIKALPGYWAPYLLIGNWM